MKAIIGENVDTISESAIAVIKRITQYTSTVMDLRSAVYMFHFGQILVKHSSTRNAYEHHIGGYYFAVFT